MDTYGCAKWTDTALSELLSLSPVVEMGAGGGQWAAQLKSLGCDILAYDNAKAIAPGGNGKCIPHPISSKVFSKKFKESKMKDMNNNSILLPLFFCFFFCLDLARYSFTRYHGHSNSLKLISLFTF